MRNNPYQDRLISVHDEYLGPDRYRRLSDVPIEARILLRELILRRNLYDIESGFLFNMMHINQAYTYLQSTSHTVAERLMRDMLESIKNKHC